MVGVKMGEDENVTRGVGMSNYPEIIYLGHFARIDQVACFLLNE